MTNPAALAVEKMIARIDEEFRGNVLYAELVVDQHSDVLSSCSRDGGYGRTVAYIERNADGTCKVSAADGSRERTLPSYGDAVRAVLDGKFGY